MPSEDDTKQHGQQGEPVAAGVDREREDGREAKREQEQRAARRYRRRRTKIARAWSAPIPLLTLVLCVITGLYTFFSWRLWQETGNAVRLTRTSLYLTTLALAETKTTNRANIEHQRLMAQATIIGLQATVQANDLARLGIEVEEAQFKAVQRPWIVPEDPVLSALKEGEQLTLSFRMVNVGQVPGYFRGARAFFYTNERPVIPQPPPRFDGALIAPGQAKRNTIKARDAVTHDQYRVIVTEKTKRLRVVIALYYDEPLGSSFREEHCFVYVPDKQALGGCADE